MNTASVWNATICVSMGLSLFALTLALSEFAGGLEMVNGNYGRESPLCRGLRNEVDDIAKGTSRLQQKLLRGDRQWRNVDAKVAEVSARMQRVRDLIASRQQWNANTPEMDSGRQALLENIFIVEHYKYLALSNLVDPTTSAMAFFELSKQPEAELLITEELEARWIARTLASSDESEMYWLMKTYRSVSASVEVTQALIYFAKYSNYSTVREAALAALGRQDSDIRVAHLISAALEDASERDPAKKVRERAARLLKKSRRN